MKRIQLTGTATAMAALLLAGIIAIALPGAAQGANGGVGQLAAATVYANGVDFQPNVAYRGAKLTVSGPTMVFERAVGANQRLSLDMFDPAGQLLPDGNYKWRLDLRPTASAARELRRSARRNGGTAPEPWLPETGIFTIKDGRMVDRDLVEDRPARRRGTDLSGALPADLGAPAAAARIADDTDDAVASGYAPETGGSAMAGNGPRSDAATLAAGPAPARLAVTDEQPASRRSSPTDGKNGRN